jgi:hypothetical protein
MECIVPMQAIAVLPLVLWESAKSITFSDVAFTLLVNSCLTRHLFLWGRKADGSIKWPQSLDTSNLLCGKISLKHIGSKNLWHDPNQDLSRVDTGEVLLLGQL